MAQIDTPYTSNPDRIIPLSDMTDEQIGALLRAQHNGKIIEYWGAPGQWVKTREPTWCGHIAYRVRAEPPKRKSVSINGNVHSGSFFAFGQRGRPDMDTHSITFDTIEGVPITGTYTNENGDEVVIGKLK